MRRSTPRPDPEGVLRQLKDFQRDTAGYVFRRMYLDDDRTRRFLIADEVGLGKTLVARGVIARAVEHLWDRVDRIDVIYICSNADIARQNTSRLKIGEASDFSLASRITLLPTQVESLKRNKLNFISFTPGTSFDLRSRLGSADERVLLYWLLRDAWGVTSAGLRNVMQGTVGAERFQALVHRSARPRIDRELASAFAQRLQRVEGMERNLGLRTLRDRFDELREQFGRLRKWIPGEQRLARAQLVGNLRALLAETCLEALQPDLIILDEFQRFKHLLDGEDAASELAKGLFDYADQQSQARVLLLSATPYRMYSLDCEAEADYHYRDFLRTLDFLLPDRQQFGQATAAVREYGRELRRMGRSADGRMADAKQALETALRRVMVRTERLSVTEDRDGMLTHVPSTSCHLQPGDLRTYRTLHRVAEVLEEHDPLEYWKSSPYLLNFMDSYELKRSFERALSNPDQCDALCRVLSQGQGVVLNWRDVRAYRQVDPDNARLRELLAGTIDRGTWRLLWMPPSLPYYQPLQAFALPEARGFTKRLVFSSWKVVPKMAAAVLSYEAERRMVQSCDRRAGMSAREERRPLLRFTRSEGRLSGMPVLGLIYPCMSLTTKCDPLRLAQEAGPQSEPIAADQMLARAQRAVSQMLRPLIEEAPTRGAEDEAWYWAAPILLDLSYVPDATRDWLLRDGAAKVWIGEDNARSAGKERSLWWDHVAEAQQLVRRDHRLGRPPRDLEEVMTLMALAGPGVTALRALWRLADVPTKSAAQRVRTQAGSVAYAFLHLFNMPEVIALLRQPDDEVPYWRRVLDYSFAGNLQSVLDEYVHVLRESLGLLSGGLEERAAKVAEAMCQALALRTAVSQADRVEPNALRRGEIPKVRMRTRYALQFGSNETEDGTDTRPQQVREAFNSPFWPFVLTTTSIGQEGLDFHCYCHAVCHWNLPANPVDLEQREGRVHRYKGHAIRKNLAEHYGLPAVSKAASDPWEVLFQRAVHDRGEGEPDLTPYWIYTEGKARIERHVPALPLSRDQERLALLRRALGAYRLLFGQSRQEELLAYLAAHYDAEQLPRLTAQFRVDLSPPRSGAHVGPKRPGRYGPQGCE